MYVKLAFRNAKRSAKDYLIYLLTLIISVGLFYGFLSITSTFYNSRLPIQMNLEYFSSKMKIIIPLIALLLIFLISYVNCYMIKRKQKEFALQTIMGMEQRTTAYLFFMETLLMGLMAILGGILLGVLLSQLISAIIMTSFGQQYQLYFSLFPDTVLWTLLFFLSLFLIIGFSNVRQIRKQKIIDMLQRNEKSLRDFAVKDIFTNWVIIAWCISTFIIYLCLKGLLPRWRDLNHEGALLLGICITSTIVFFSLVILFLIITVLIKKDGSLLSVLMSIVGLISGITLLHLCDTFDQLVRLGILKQLYGTFPPLLAMAIILFSIISAFSGFSWLILQIKKKSTSFKYNHLFLLGQITSRLKINSETMGILTCILMMALVLLSWLPIYAKQTDGYLKVRSVYDVQIFTGYKTVKNINDLPKGSMDYSYIDHYLAKGNYTLKGSANVETYFLQDSDFKIRTKKDLPILGISLSNYNALLKLSGYDEVSLPKNGFSVIWNNTALPDEIKELENEHPIILASNYTLKKIPNTDYQVAVGMGIFTSGMKAVYILPDYVCNNLTLATTYYVANTTKPLSYDFAKTMNMDIGNWVNKAGVLSKDRFYIRLKTLQINEGISNSLMLRLGGSYTCLVLMVICFTILSLQQLIDATEHKKRFQVIKKLGVDECEIGRYIRQQMFVWFGVPTLIAFCGAGATLVYLGLKNYRNYIVYITLGQVASDILNIFGIFAMILICYFTVTYILFKRTITD
ncbi:FtsX-like permease family protein [Clostridium lundense]|uniref:FtsX-like permease family protein n=1 Tax=Clostridium lundense TaxID=319475 RepID=UPI000558897F|nr:FtsX-like permease family protein [Clostridium lundense]